MFRQVSLAAAALLSVSGIAVVLPASSVAATASDSHQHTLRVSSKRAAEVQYKHGGFTEADKILSRSGRPLGTGVSDCTPVSPTKADCTGVAQDSCWRGSARKE